MSRMKVDKITENLPIDSKYSILACVLGVVFIEIAVFTGTLLFLLGTMVCLALLMYIVEYNKEKDGSSHIEFTDIEPETEEMFMLEGRRIYNILNKNGLKGVWTMLSAQCANTSIDDVQQEPEFEVLKSVAIAVAIMNGIEEKNNGA